MTTRRFFLGSVLSGAALLAARPASAQGAAELRGAIDAAQGGVRANATDAQTAALQRMVDRAAADGRPLFLPGGRYLVSDLRLPSGAHIEGVPGATRIVFTGEGRFVTAENQDRVSLRNLTFDGQARATRDAARGLVSIVHSRRVTVSGVEVVRSVQNGLHLERVQGHVERCHVEAVRRTGLFALDSRGLVIRDSIVADCGDNGIQVWRSEAGEDGTLVTGNRVSNIRSESGGNGQNGNGINVYRAGGVVISQNRTETCAFSAVRVNAGANCQITGNTALGCGEVAIFVEFGFLSAIVAQNMIDGAAAGISVTNFDHGGRLAAVTGNIVRNLLPRSPVNPDTTPYGIAAEADATMTGNLVENSPGIGLLLGWGPYLRNVTATGNLVRTADIGIAVSVAQGAGRAVVTDNIVSQARRGALVGMEWTRIASPDLARGEAGVHRNIVHRGNIAA